ncbi:MAG: threonine--tRNA ligase [Myxococcota bacterium]
MSVEEIELGLPDGTRMSFPRGTTAREVAERIGRRLARDAVAARLDGRWLDLREPLEQGGALQIVTTRDPEAGEVIRHSAEHVMADAVKRLWPETRIDVGRSDHGEKFQYDLDVPVRLSPEDLPRIEAEMQGIVDAALPFERQTASRAEALELFRSLGEELKVSRIADIPEGETITLFRHGDFVDLCRGPHVQHTGQIGAFELTDLAGSYWRSDERNKMLQRIYGVAFASRKELAAYRQRLEEARRRDHRRLGAELGLFSFHEWSQGSAFYLPKGVVLYNGLVSYMRELYGKYGYQEVICPLIFSTELFKISGHYELFKDDMFIMQGDEGEEIGLKPMNCPGHALLFRATKRSYRELPLRLAEFSKLHRNERSGTLLGLTRVRSFAQDDAHIFCEPSQVASEVERFFEMTAEVYRDLGLGGVDVYVSTRGKEFIGDPAAWEEAERALIEAVEGAGFECKLKPGEAAFYAPKVEFDFCDALGRAWTLATIQVDMAMPERFGLRYVGADGAEHRPSMLHRAVLGSLERFIAIYLEHTEGDLPLWLAPVQAVVLPVAERHEEFARKVVDVLTSAKIRADLDARGETLSYRVRGAETQKVPCILVVGDREQADGTISLRRRHQKGQRSIGVDEFRSQLEEEIRTRGIS